MLLSCQSVCASLWWWWWVWVLSMSGVVLADVGVRVVVVSVLEGGDRHEWGQAAQQAVVAYRQAYR